MLSYRHAYHAGNHADVLKHLVLVSCLEHLGKKETPYRYVDTHAGAGCYRLGSGYAAEREEWQDGVERLRAFTEASRTEGVPDAIRGYLARLDSFRSARGSDAYPGSPSVAAIFLRPRDRSFLFELHPADHRTLEAEFAGDTRIRVRREDGLAGLKALLPPPSRRALTLIDPSYEVKDEYDRVVQTVADALRRFRTGVFLIWYPLLDREDARSLPDRLLALHEGHKCRAELRVKPPRQDGRGMRGSGMIVLNPPWTLRAALEEGLPYLERALGDEDAASDLLWEEPKGRDATGQEEAVSNKQHLPQGRTVP